MAGWTKTMHLISGSNRLMEKVNIFGGRGKNAASAEQRLVAEIEALERQVRCGAVPCRAVWRSTVFASSLSMVGRLGRGWGPSWEAGENYPCHLLDPSPLGLTVVVG